MGWPRTLVLLAVSCFAFALASPTASWGKYVAKSHGESSDGLHYEVEFVSSGVVPDYGAAIPNLFVNFTYLSDNTLRVKVTDAQQSRWEVPDIVQLPAQIKADNKEYTVKVVEDPFSFTVTKKDGQVIFDGHTLFFANQYIELTTNLVANTNIYGLGERVGPLRFDLTQEETYSFMASDHGTPDKLPLYGSHPFYLQINQNNGTSSSHGVFLLNSNAMDVTLSAQYLTYKTTGGILDLYMFTGPTPAQVTKQYHALIGTPALPPYWSLGYHQCRWGYEKLSDLEDVINNFIHYDIPVDTFWVDIDYMDKWRVFTTDPVNFPIKEMGALIDTLHSRGQHFVPITDPGVRIDNDYAAYQDGLKRDIFVRDPTGLNYSVGKVWPGLVMFPDWTHPNTTQYWFDHLKAFHDQIAIDGLWTDMNEVASFCDGRCKLDWSDDYDKPSLFSCNCTMDKRFDTGLLDDPPYQPVDTRNRECRSITGDIHGLDVGTMSMANKLYAGEQYNMHNLYGHTEAVLSKVVMEKLRGKRAFTLTRSTFAGTGHHAAHWLGDNESTWHALRMALPGILNFNLFGVSLVGPDICGFSGDTTAELCQRWMEVGAFYPFMRNHNVEHAISQEPYAFGEDVLRSSVAALKARYSLLPYYYTQFYKAHVEGGSVARPLFYEFPNDAKTFGIDAQFLIGGDVLVSPVMTAGVTEVAAYFPQADWYDFFHGSLTVPRASSAQSHTLHTPLDKIQVHVRGGAVLAMQQPANNTVNQKYNPYYLTVALDQNADLVGKKQRVGFGELYADDGDSLDTIQNKQFTLMHFEVISANVSDKFTIKGSVKNGGYKDSRLLFNKVVLFGAQCQPHTVRVNGKRVELANAVVNRDDALEIQGLNLALGKSFSVEFFCSAPTDDLTNTYVALIAIAGMLAAFAVIGGIFLCVKRSPSAPAQSDYHPIQH